MKQFFTDKELKNSLESIHEKSFIELKKASQLPKSFWESYSAFCNTSGGWIILGVEEAKPKNIIHTIENADKMIADIWNQLSNDNKVNYRSIENRDINKYEIDGKTIIIVKVNEAPEFQKPVYINGKIENTYIRTGDGDRKAKETELASFYRNDQPCQDTLVAEGITIDDLDMDSVISFKERTHKRYPKKKYISMTNEEFLVEIGACVINRETGKHMIKRVHCYSLENAIL